MFIFNKKEKNMKKIILLISLIGAAYASETSPEECCCSEPTVHSSFGYLTAGIGPIPCPGLNIGVGKRFVTGESTGMDFGVQASTVLFVSAVKGYANHLWYFNQKPRSQWYVGFGGSVGGVLFMGFCDFTINGFGAPNILFGREFLTRKGNKRFIEIETMYPLFLFQEFVNCPAVTIKFGFAF